LDSMPVHRLDALLLRARVMMARRQFAEAARLANEAIALAPQAIWPREVLSHVLLAEGRDFAAAEHAVRNVLALDPQHAGARGNLAWLEHRDASRPAVNSN